MSFLKPGQEKRFDYYLNRNQQQHHVSSWPGSSLIRLDSAHQNRWRPLGTRWMRNQRVLSEKRSGAIRTSSRHIAPARLRPCVSDAGAAAKWSRSDLSSCSSWQWRCPEGSTWPLVSHTKDFSSALRSFFLCHAQANTWTSCADAKSSAKIIKSRLRVISKCTMFKLCVLWLVTACNSGLDFTFARKIFRLKWKQPWKLAI